MGDDGIESLPDHPTVNMSLRQATGPEVNRVNRAKSLFERGHGPLIGSDLTEIGVRRQTKFRTHFIQGGQAKIMPTLNVDRSQVDRRRWIDEKVTQVIDN